MGYAGRLAAAIGFVVVSAHLAAAQSGKWSHAEVYEENDTLAPSAVSSDALYTQGFRLVFMRHPDHEFGFAEKVQTFWGPLLGDDPHRASGGVAFGQNMFTPVDILTFEPDPTDRPYAGFLYGGLRVDIVRTDGNARHSFELNAGILGKPAFAREAQSGLHVLRLHRIPKGWDEQIGIEPAANLRYAQHHRIGWHFLDLTGGFGATLGTIQVFPQGDATLRVGWRMTGMPLSAAPFSAREDTDRARERRAFEFGFMAGIEGRYMLHNAYLDGGTFTDGPAVEKERGVHDVRYGFSGRFRSWRLTYSLVRRSREFVGEKGGPHHFGSVAISREVFTDDAAHGPCAGECLWRNWLVELGMGTGTGWLDPEPPGPRKSGPVGRFGISRGLTCLPAEKQTRLKERFALGYERAGVVREGPRRDADDGFHRDDFLVIDALTLRLRPFAPKGGNPHRLHLRVGAGAATAKREITLSRTEFEETSESGFGALVGADYMFRLARGPLSFGVDVTAGQAWIDGDVYDRGRFLTGALLIHWHP